MNFPTSASASPSTSCVAVYWDFENLHAALYERDWGGSRSYAEPRYRFTQQDVLVNVKAVLDYAASVGDVAINRAYNNWQWFSRYRDVLNITGIDLIQIYPKGTRAKNGADIRLALDVLEDTFRFRKLTHVIIVSSDSDFVSLAQKLKQSGLTVIGVGVQQATNLYWAQNCDEFRYYDTLLGLADEVSQAGPRVETDEEGEPAVKPMSLDDAKRLMVDALRRLIAQKGTEQVTRGGLKQMMKRMDSTFDEANLGFLNFASFVRSFPDVVEDIPDESGGQVRLRASGERPQAIEGVTPEIQAAPAEQDYELLLKRGNVRLLPSPWWREAVQVVDEIFREAPQGQLIAFDDLEGELSARLDAAGLDGDPEMAHRLRGFLFALRQFQLDKEKQPIGLRVSGNRTLLQNVDREIVRRLVKYAAPPVHTAKVAAILYDSDSPDSLAKAQELVDGLT